MKCSSLGEITVMDQLSCVMRTDKTLLYYLTHPLVITFSKTVSYSDYQIFRQDAAASYVEYMTTTVPSHYENGHPIHKLYDNYEVDYKNVGPELNHVSVIDISMSQAYKSSIKSSGWYSSVPYNYGKPVSVCRLV
jgi:hypothetical protein